MPDNGPTLASKAFGEHADSALIVAYESHQDALRFLSAALSHANGIAMLQGPMGSGKTTVVKAQLDWSASDAQVAIVDGAKLTPRQLAVRMLEQFGVESIPRDDEQMLESINRFLTQQTRTARAPILIVDNADRARSSTLSLLNWLAALEVGNRYALRIVLTGRERLWALVSERSLRHLARRHPTTYSLNPLTRPETIIYLRTRFVAAGGERSETVFPVDVCDRLYELSRGWPGRLNEYALGAMARGDELKGAKPVPRIILTCDGETVARHDLKNEQYVIGRSDLADIVIKDNFVSNLHALLRVYANAIVLLDLNSTNGTTVNSIEVPRTVLRNNDIISLGRHRLKIVNVPALSADMEEKVRASDTIVMKNLDDVRRSRARHNIAVKKHKWPAL
jgi:type II secretory pathway predicted ATPase ExeA